MMQKKSSGETVLALLAAGDGWHSGEDMADRLGVSRAAVAKHIAALRGKGHIIESVTNRGYRLAVMAEPVCPETVRRALTSRVFGRKEWRTLDAAASTNNEAIAWALAGAVEGSVVTAEQQTGGKGRKGREWFSSPHGLQFSVILRPGPKGPDEEAVTAAALRSVAAAAEDLTGLAPAVKQPNDLLLNGRKFSGILVESGLRGGEPDWTAVGIGCNVNVLPEAFPDSLRDRVTSLYAAGGKPVSKNLFLAAILSRFEENIRRLRR